MESRRPSGHPDDLDLDAFTGEEPPSPKERRSVLLWVAVGIVVVLAIPLYVVFANTRRNVSDVEAELRVVEKKIADAGTLGPEDQILMKTLTQTQELAVSINDAYSSIAAGHLDWPDIMSSIGGYNPQDIALASLAQAGTQITLQGRALSDSAVGAYHRGLEGSGLFLASSCNLLSASRIPAKRRVPQRRVHLPRW